MRDKFLISEVEEIKLTYIANCFINEKDKVRKLPVQTFLYATEIRSLQCFKQISPHTVGSIRAFFFMQIYL
jgi:hypothetical protein